MKRPGLTPRTLEAKTALVTLHTEEEVRRQIECVEVRPPPTL